MTQKILYSRPSIIELEIEYVTDVACNGWGDQCYAHINRFEKQLAALVGTQYAIATPSYTGATHMGLVTFGIGAGDEVILADTDWIAAAPPITYVGATPVFVDILSDTWCLDPALVEAAITPRAKAIVATHLYGNLCEVDRPPDIGKRHGTPVIEDVAEAVGSRWHGHATGSQGIFGTFSFYGTKTMTTGEGGMLVISDRVLYDRVMTLNNHGRALGGKQLWSDFIDLKYRISNVQAAIGCAQLERIDAPVARKHEIFVEYQAYLGGVAGSALNPETPGTLNSYWMSTVVFDEAPGVTRDGLLAAFPCHGIDVRVFFYPLSQMGLFGDALDNAPNNYAIAEHAINLPSYHDTSSVDIDTVSQVVLDLVQEHQEKQMCLASWLPTRSRPSNATVC